MKESLFKGISVLMIAGIVVKLLGALFKIPIVNLIGDAGMSCYAPAYNIYNFFLALSISGIPVAISKMISENVALRKYEDAHFVFELSRRMMIFIGTISFVLVFFLADEFANYIGVPEAALALKSIAPALFVVPIIASYRGLFQGVRNMEPTAKSQVIEQVIRVTGGLVFAYLLFDGAIGKELDIYSYPSKGAAGATFGATVGAIGSMFYIIVQYYKNRKSLMVKEISHIESFEKQYTISILKRIIRIAVPITIGAMLMPIAGVVDVVVVNRRLIEFGLSVKAANGLYGQLTGFATPLVNLPQVFLQAISANVIPLVAALYQKHDAAELRTNIKDSCKFTMIISIPCAIGLIILAKQILLFIYPKQMESAMNATQCLEILSVGIIFIAIVQVSTSILQGIGKQMIPVRNLAFGIIIKIFATWHLVPIMGINGAAIGTVVAYFSAAVLDMIAIKKHIGVSIVDYDILIKPLLCAAIMGAITSISYRILYGVFNSTSVTLILTIASAIAIYFMVLVITKTVTPKELATLPGGKRIVKLIYRK